MQRLQLVLGRGHLVLGAGVRLLAFHDLAKSGSTRSVRRQPWFHFNMNQMSVYEHQFGWAILG